MTKIDVEDDIDETEEMHYSDYEHLENEATEDRKQNNNNDIDKPNVEPNKSAK